MMKTGEKLDHMDGTITLDHGAGGLLSRELIERLVVPALGDRYLGNMEDSATLELPSNKVATTTDSFVIDPPFFYNGDIGKLAICGTVNDLAVSGANPLYLTFSMIIEAGLPLRDLHQIVASAAAAAEEANVYIVAGDTKVVDKGAADKIFINTSGIGVFENWSSVLAVRKIAVGDEIIVTSSIGNHSIHLLSLREGLGFESNVLSDCAPLNHMIRDVMLAFGDQIHCIRDLTRGGLGTALNEIAVDAGMRMSIEMAQIPVQHETKMAAELLGLNPIYLANEGCCCIFCSPDIVHSLLQVLHNHKYGVHAARIGKVEVSGNSSVVGILDGSRKIIESLTGRQVPRLC